MNIFLIPSWYPSARQPIAGIFTREQAEAVAALCADIRVIVSTWGHAEGTIPLRKPLQAFETFRWWLRQPNNQITVRNGVFEVFNPVLDWSSRLPFGGAQRLLNANRQNYKLAEKQFGKVDLIHAHVSYPAGYIARLLSKEFDAPYILTEHMSPFPFPSHLKKGRPRQEIIEAFAHAAASVAVSPSLARRIASFGFAEPVVIPNVVDERKFQISMPESNRFVFFTLCGLSDQKGIDHLLQAIALWNPSPLEVEFRIGGDGPLRKSYETMAVDLGLTDRVRFLGPISREDAPELFGQCHAYVMPSRHETFGIVYAEAIASGKPVIATRCGGPESIVNEGNGLLVDIGDIETLARAMQHMVRDWHHYDPLRIRQDFENRFSRQAVVERLVELYQSVTHRI